MPTPTLQQLFKWLLYCLNKLPDTFLEDGIPAGEGGWNKRINVTEYIDGIEAAIIEFYNAVKEQDANKVIAELLQNRLEEKHREKLAYYGEYQKEYSKDIESKLSVFEKVNQLFILSLQKQQRPDFLKDSSRKISASEQAYKALVEQVRENQLVPIDSFNLEQVTLLRKIQTEKDIFEENKLQFLADSSEIKFESYKSKIEASVARLEGYYRTLTEKLIEAIETRFDLLQQDFYGLMAIGGIKKEKFEKRHAKIFGEIAECKAKIKEKYGLLKTVSEQADLAPIVIVIRGLADEISEKYLTLQLEAKKEALSQLEARVQEVRKQIDSLAELAKKKSLNVTYEQGKQKITEQESRIQALFQKLNNLVIGTLTQISENIRNDKKTIEEVHLVMDASQKIYADLVKEIAEKEIEEAAQAFTQLYQQSRLNEKFDANCSEVMVAIQSYKVKHNELYAELASAKTFKDSKRIAEEIKYNATELSRTYKVAADLLSANIVALAKEKIKEVSTVSSSTEEVESQTNTNLYAVQGNFLFIIYRIGKYKNADQLLAAVNYYKTKFEEMGKEFTDCETEVEKNKIGNRIKAWMTIVKTTHQAINQKLEAITEIDELSSSVAILQETTQQNNLMLDDSYSRHLAQWKKQITEDIYKDCESLAAELHTNVVHQAKEQLEAIAKEKSQLEGQYKRHLERRGYYREVYQGVEKLGSEGNALKAADQAYEAKFGEMEKQFKLQTGQHSSLGQARKTVKQFEKNPHPTTDSFEVLQGSLKCAAETNTQLNECCAEANQKLNTCIAEADKKLQQMQREIDKEITRVKLTSPLYLEGKKKWEALQALKNTLMQAMVGADATTVKQVVAEWKGKQVEGRSYAEIVEAPRVTIFSKLFGSGKAGVEVAKTGKFIEELEQNYGKVNIKGPGQGR